MKSYLCIGGPLHGERHAIPDGVPVLRIHKLHDRATFSEEFIQPHSLAHEERYTVKQFGIGESRDEPTMTNSEGLSVRVRLDIQGAALVHESVLTVEEVAAQFRKLRPHAISDAVEKAFVRMKLTR